MKLKTDSFPHQNECAEKFSRLKVGALFMEMGTGKTRTMLEIIKNKHQKMKFDKVLWLCPCSAKLNIKVEIEKHLKDAHDLFFICGIESLSSSDLLYNYLLKFVERFKTFIVADESLKIKNPLAIRSQRIQIISEKCVYRFILNGTPISKDERDLFQQFYFLDYRILGYRSYYSFCNNHVIFHDNRPPDMINTDYINISIAPYVFQKKLSEVMSLNGKIEDNFSFKLTEDQEINYFYTSEYLFDKLNEREPATIYRLFTCLCLICSGYLINFTEKDETIKTKLFPDPYKNPRIRALLYLIKSNYHNNEKIIIFARFTDEIEDIFNVLTETYGTESAKTFYGKTKKSEKSENIKAFSSYSRFLIANKSSLGFSWNLQFCSNVIFYNNDWDYATREQAEDRVFRIGQEKTVLIHNIYAYNSLESRILDCLSEKESLLRAFKRKVIKNKDVSFHDEFSVFIKNKTHKFQIKEIEEIVDENL